MRAKKKKVQEKPDIKTQIVLKERLKKRRGDDVSMSQADDFLVKIQEAESANA